MGGVGIVVNSSPSYRETHFLCCLDGDGGAAGGLIFGYDLVFQVSGTDPTEIRRDDYDDVRASVSLRDVSVPCNYRGRFNVLFQLMITIGILCANVINYLTDKISGGWGWRVSLGLAGVPALIILVASFFLSDTPNSLVERGMEDEAKTLLKRIRGVDDVEAEFTDMLQARNEARLVENPWRNLVTRRCYRPQLAMSILIPFFSSLRVAIAAFNRFQIRRHRKRDRNTNLVRVRGGGVHMRLCGGFRVVVGPTRVVVPQRDIPSGDPVGGAERRGGGEHAVDLRSRSVFLSMLCAMKYGLFIIFAFFVVVMTLFCYFFMPETKNIPIEEMTQVWRNHWFWKRFMNDRMIR
ncbi:hypothetical protein DH2020_018479 [Rehmannia glutinosa]|uniref:Uncharacterized protein n=1 Tax=Rehmannia glutinosa TaxID=99300 RepID=A0ABR0WMM6_REHGL